VYEHKLGLIPGFTQKYKVERLVYFETTNDAYEALAREKQLKKWKRDWKLSLIESVNPNWDDLAKLDYVWIPAYARMTLRRHRG
jgi:putative endonuclease